MKPVAGLRLTGLVFFEMGMAGKRQENAIPGRPHEPIAGQIDRKSA